MTNLFHISVFLSDCLLFGLASPHLGWRNGCDSSLLHLHKVSLHVGPPSLISRLLAGMCGIFPLIKEISRLPCNLVVMETAVTWPKVRQTLDERRLALWRASVPLSIYLTRLPGKQGSETGSWEEMWTLVCLDNRKEAACTVLLARICQIHTPFYICFWYHLLKFSLCIVLISTFFIKLYRLQLYRFKPLSNLHQIHVFLLILTVTNANIFVQCSTISK